MTGNIDKAIRTNAERPRSASGDSESVQQHPLQDRIAVDRYLASKGGRRRLFRTTVLGTLHLVDEGRGNAIGQECRRAAVGFWSNMLMAVVSAIHPVLGFIGSVVRYVFSTAKNRAATFLLDVVSQLLPGGFAKDVAVGLVDDILEMDCLSEAVDRVVPFNDIVLRCEVCGRYSRYYVKDEGEIRCKRCFERRVDKEIQVDDKIYVRTNGIYRLRSDLSERNRDIVTHDQTADLRQYPFLGRLPRREGPLSSGLPDLGLGGSGWLTGLSEAHRERYEPCPRCNGTGRQRVLDGVPKPIQVLTFIMSAGISNLCMALDKEKCERCGGTGRVPSDE